MSVSQPLPLIGWREVVALPQLSIPEIKVKVDTGGRSSALHAYDLEQYSQQGETMIRFWVHPYQKNTQYSIQGEAKLIAMRNVRNSGGVSQSRPVIETVVKSGEKEWSIELTLTNRD